MTGIVLAKSSPRRAAALAKWNVTEMQAMVEAGGPRAAAACKIAASLQTCIGHLHQHVSEAGESLDATSLVPAVCFSLMCLLPNFLQLSCKL